MKLVNLLEAIIPIDEIILIEKIDKEYFLEKNCYIIKVIYNKDFYLDEYEIWYTTKDKRDVCFNLLANFLTEKVII